MKVDGSFIFIVIIIIVMSAAVSLSIKAAPLLLEHAPAKCSFLVDGDQSVLITLTLCNIINIIMKVGNIIITNDANIEHSKCRSEPIKQGQCTA